MQVVQGNMVNKRNDEHHTSGVSKISAYNWKMIDSPGKQMMIPKSQLLIEQRYQRVLDHVRALKMSKEWSWAAFAAISVAFRDDMYFVIDGQHRVAAALKRADITDLPCVVFDLSSVAEEAVAFLKTNQSRQALRTNQIIPALTTIGDPAAMLVSKLVKDSGRSLSCSSNATQVGCVRALLLWAKTSGDKLEKLYPIVSDICAGNVLHGMLLSGIMYLETNFEDNNSLLDPVIKNRLLKIGFSKLVEAIEASRTYHGKGGPRIAAIGVLNAINKGRRINLAIKS